MEVVVPFGDERRTCDIPVACEQIKVVMSENPRSPEEWERITELALSHPLGVKPLSQTDFADKSVVVITDDWGRPTPASKVIPSVLRELKRGGARDEDITFVTGSGMHDPMGEEDLRRKLGSDIVDRYTCISHDGGDTDNLTFMGLSALGTPIWVNRWVAEADFRVVIGRVYLHNTHGYEGGYKMVLPAVSAFETIVRDHGMNFSPTSDYGIAVGNPSRDETDAIGRRVRLDFVLNFVVNHDAAPVNAYAGEPLLAHRSAIVYGERHVWGAEIGEKADVTLASPGSISDVALSRRALTMAMRGTKPGGTIILLTGDVDQEAEEERRKKNRWQDISWSELFHLHDKRDWDASPRETQWTIKSLRTEFYRRRLTERDCRLILVGGSIDPGTLAEFNAEHSDSLQAAIETCMQRYGSAAQVLVLPEAARTLPCEKFTDFYRVDRRA